LVFKVDVLRDFDKVIEFLGQKYFGHKELRASDGLLIYDGKLEQ
jgi:hypothetical protein